MGLLTEFKEFAVKGNVVDMAVGIIIGAAFGKIVSSVVNDVIMPAIGYMIGGVNFTDFAYILQEATETTEAVAINYGSTIQTIIDFLIVAAAVFVGIKAMNSMKRAEEEVAEEPAGPTQEELLADIRDLLKKDA